MNPVNRQVRLAARPSGLPKPADWKLTTEPVPAPGRGEFVVAISYLSIERFPSSLRRVNLQSVDGLGELSGAPGAAAELAENAPGLQLGVRALGG